MRISSSLIFQTGLKTINTQQSDLLHLYEQIGRGQKMVTPADDPLAASQAINISQSQALNSRYADNRSVANRNLATEEDALNSLTLLLQDVRTRLVQAGNGTLSDADRGTLAGVLEKARETALGIANTTDGNGQYVFSGSKGDTAAYGLQNPSMPVGPGNSYAYQGDNLQRNIQADATRRIAGSDIGADVFDRAQPGTRAYSSLQVVQGAGSTAVLGRPAIADNTVGNQDAKYQFGIEFIDNAGTLEYTITTTEQPGNVLISTVTTPWTDGQTSIDLGYGTTVEVSGQPAIGDEFEVSPLKHESLNLFASLDSMINALNTPSQGDDSATAQLRNVLNTTMQRVASNYDNVLTVRASVGARMNELAALDGSGTQRNLGFTQALIELEDLDYYDATMKLNLRKMALEGAALAFQTIQNLSLFNMGGR